MGIRRKRNPSENYFDYSLLFIVLFLLGFGLVMIYSTSSYEANLQGHESTFYLRKQVMATVLGLVAMIVVANIPYRIYERFAVLAYFGSAALILMVLIPQIRYTANGATRWIRVAGITLQPAEVAKLGIIITLASLICRVGRAIRTTRGFFTVLAVPLPICIMIRGFTNNMSSAIIVFGIAALMLFVASPEYKKFIIMGIGGMAALALLVFAISQASMTEGMGFRSERILAWLNPEAHSSDKGFQTVQALYAIGSGGILGKGLGQSMQKLGFLPEAQNDMIFSIICEELVWGNCDYTHVSFANLEVYGDCQQCNGFIRCSAGGGGDGAYRYSGYLKYRGSDQYHTEYGDFPPLYQLRGIGGYVPFDRNRNGA